MPRVSKIFDWRTLPPTSAQRNFLTQNIRLCQGFGGQADRRNVKILNRGQCARIISAFLREAEAEAWAYSFPDIDDNEFYGQD